MENFDVNLGQVVLSTAGRDKGKLFVVIEQCGEGFVKISDGNLRKIDKGKLKNIKHLKKTNHVICQLKKRLEEDKKITDAEIRSYLVDYRI